jgi:hypothetical protein
MLDTMEKKKHPVDLQNIDKPESSSATARKSRDSVYSLASTMAPVASSSS